MHAFIIRPFGEKEGIDFDRVDRELISPALEELDCTGRTTGEIVRQGNIRTDLFEQLLIADLVIADVSLHNANVFYELGIRHALRDKRTFLIKSQGEEVPFDLKTDRYLPYDAGNPAASLAELVEALRATCDSQEQDSPVFQLLPGLQPTDPARFLPVPLDFREEVERAEAHRKAGDLQMLSAELDGLSWRVAGLRLVGNAQFRLEDSLGARATWEAVRSDDDTDLEANTRLATIFQRLGDLVKSDQAVKRALQSPDGSLWDRAEIRALMARNAKTRWQQDWAEEQGKDAAQEAALASPHLSSSFELYCEGFAEDRNHYYSGLNAVAMATIMARLAAAKPEVWNVDFGTDGEARRELERLDELRRDLSSAVKLAIETKRAAPDGEIRAWAEISAADLQFLTSDRPERVGRTYQKVLAGAPGFMCDSARNQILLYQSLGILEENARAALDSIPAGPGGVAPEEPPRVILFTGHRIDAESREQPRFPREKETLARTMIAEAVADEKRKATGRLIGLSGGASGGDIIFHEVCAELGIPSKMYLILPRDDYVRKSVADGGLGWVERFDRLVQKHPLRVLSDSAELPRWLRAKSGYSLWQRSNLWMLHSALELSRDDLVLIALWNGEAGDGPGGTQDMVDRAGDRGARFIHLDARKLID